MIGVQDLRKGTTFMEDNELFRVLDYQHIKSGRGNATIRVKVRNVRSGSTMEKTYPSGSRVQDVRLDHSEVQYLYHDGDLYTFMNVETYEQPVLSADVARRRGPFPRRQHGRGPRDVRGRERSAWRCRRRSTWKSCRRTRLCRRHGHERHQARGCSDRATRCRCRCSSTSATRSGSTPGPANT